MRSVAPLTDDLGTAHAVLHHVDCTQETLCPVLEVRTFESFDRICRQLKGEKLPVIRDKLSDYGAEGAFKPAVVDAPKVTSLAELTSVNTLGSTSGGAATFSVARPAEPVSPLKLSHKRAALERQSPITFPESQQDEEDTASRDLLEFAPSGISWVVQSGPSPRNKPRTVKKASIFSTRPARPIDPYKDLDGLDGGVCGNVWKCESHSHLWTSPVGEAKHQVREANQQQDVFASPRRKLPSGAVKPNGYRNTGEMRVARNLNLNARLRLDEYVNEKNSECKGPEVIDPSQMALDARQASLRLDPRETHASRGFNVIPAINLRVT